MTSSTRSYAYRIAGVVVELPEFLHWLVREDSAPDFVVSWGVVPPRVSGRLLRAVEHDGFVWLRIEVVNTATSYTFPGLGGFIVQPDSGKIGCWAETQTQSNTMWHLLVDQVLPLHLASQGQFVLHASSVATGGERHSRAILFLGESGAGKSSTAMGCEHVGATLLGDDFARISLDVDPPAITPANVGVRLWEEMVAAISPEQRAAPVAEFTSKLRVVPSPARSQVITDSLPIGALVFLGPRLPTANEPLFETISSATAFMHLLEGSYRVTVADAEDRLRAVDQAARLVNAVPSVRLSMPENVDGISASCARVLELIQDILQPALPPTR